jgi:hypothetical protein
MAFLAGRTGLHARAGHGPGRFPHARAEAPDPVAHLVALAGAGAALRRAVARIAGRLVALRGWERLGFARARDYAVERAGISGRQLLELARTDGALRELPQVEAAFVAGELTWTKARLLARVATREDEGAWLARARRLSARALAREVRAVDARALENGGAETDEDGEEEGARETVFVRCTPAVRAKWHRARFLASRCEGRPVPPWAVAERVAAEVLSAWPLDASALRSLEVDAALATAERAAVERVEAERTGADRLPSEPAALSADGSRERSPAARAADVCACSALPGVDGSEGSGVTVAGSRAANGCARDAPPERHPAEAAGAGVARPRAANGCAAHAPPRAEVVEISAGERPEGRGAPLAPAAFAEQLLAGLDEADAFELDTRLRRALALEQRLHARMGPWLLEVADGRLYRGAGCASLGTFARERLGFSPRKAAALLRLERACRIAPALREAYRAGRLSWVQAQTLAPIACLEGAAHWHAAWVALAERVAVRRLDDEVDRAVALAAPEPPPLEPPWLGQAGTGACARSEGAGGAVEAVGAAASDPQTGARPTPRPEMVRFFFNAPLDVARLFRATLATVQRRIERRNGRTASEGEALDAMLEHAFETWERPFAKLRREHRVFARDGWRCSVPGCTSYSNLQDHHIDFRSRGGSNDLANRTALCAWHHLRALHVDGVVRVKGRAPGGLRFELGVRRGQAPLAIYRSGDRLET